MRGCAGADISSLASSALRHMIAELSTWQPNFVRAPLARNVRFFLAAGASSRPASSFRGSVGLAGVPSFSAICLAVRLCACILCARPNGLMFDRRSTTASEFLAHRARLEISHTKFRETLHLLDPDASTLAQAAVNSRCSQHLGQHGYGVCMCMCMCMCTRTFTRVSVDVDVHEQL